MTDAEGSSLVCQRLRCEHRIDPIGLDVERPRFGWIVAGEGRGRRQTAYRVTVDAIGASNDPVWDSGKIDSSLTVDIDYEGRPLQPFTRYRWSVRSWDEAGRPSEVEAATFETGLLGLPWPAGWLAQAEPGPEQWEAPEGYPYDNEFQARPPVYFRKAVLLKATPRAARIYATALGVYELCVNGEKVGQDLLAPGWTDYHSRVEYQVHDVTGLLRRGENALGTLLGEGWYSGYLGFNRRRPAAIYGDRPQVSLLLRVEYEDGSVESFLTDESWRCANGPIVYSDLLMGETYDTRLEDAGWSRVGFDDGGWAEPEIGSGPRGIVHAATGPAIGVTRIVKPIRETGPSKGTRVYDFGQNLVGRLRLRCAGPSGKRLTLRHAEALDAGGRVYVDNLRSARAEDCIILAGAKLDWTPTFTFHGFRYVEVAGLDDETSLEAIEAEVIQSRMEETSTFETSSALLNQLHANILWSQRGNFIAVPTDCPQRDERLGWLADAQVFLPTAACNMDVQSFMSKWMTDVLDAQSADGAFPDVAPRGPLAQDGAPAWGDAGIIVPMTLYDIYGDRRLLARCYPAMQRWLELVRRQNPDHIRMFGCNANFGDWLSIGERSSKPLVATAYFARIANLMARAAEILGQDEDAARYASLFESVRATFQARFLKDDGRLEGDTQTAYLLAIDFELLPETRIASAVNHLVANIRRRGNRLATGFIGVRHLCPVLSRHGYNELAYQLALETGYPSWGYSIANGATTIWERWDGWTAEKGFQSPKMNSLNHYSFGAIGEWLVGYAAGLRRNLGEGAHFTIAPMPGPGLDWCRASLQTQVGRVASAWRRVARGVEIEVEIPANATASIYLPAGKGIAGSDLSRFEGRTCALHSRSSGTYAFFVPEAA